jgi:hypothetical protein
MDGAPSVNPVYLAYSAHSMLTPRVVVDSM